MKRITFWLHRFVMAYGIIMLGTFFMCLLFNRQSVLPVVRFFGRGIILDCLCLLTIVVYSSRNELTQSQWWVRTVIHLVVLEAVLLPLARHWHFWYGKVDCMIYASFILLGKVLWHLVDYGRSIRAAEELNEALRKRSKSKLGEEGK